jgi:GNAT superfamily N-acetyltransferase
MGWEKWQRERVETVHKALLNENHLVLVAEADGKIVGVLHLIFYLDILLAALNCHVNFLLVRKEYRGRKIGSKLLDIAVKKARKKGAIEIHVDTIEAPNFYRKYGFKDDGVWLELSLLEKK